VLDRSAAVAEQVRSFYDRHPYPPPVDDLESYRRRWDDLRRRRADHHLFWPARPYRDDPSILVAGCGTAQAAKHALRWPRARVIGIDVSATSVRFTEALKRKHDIANLEVRQLSLERAAELNVRFDQIVCTGVLHHLPDPPAGLTALRDALAPGGVLYLMVYAPYGRTGIYMVQDLCRRLGIRPVAEEIPALVAALGALPAEHPLAALLRRAPDFRNASALADALLHPQDRAYSVPQLFDFIRDAGLAFVRWFRQAPYNPRCGVLDRLPQRTRLMQLPAEEQYAAAELFRGTMLCHSLAVRRDDDVHAPRPVSFAGEAWADYVPIRQPEAIAVRETQRLPAGAAAVLINPSHSHTDLFLPIDAAEERLLDGIDGARSIGDIARSEGLLDRAGAFFERLHEYDQVVFDTSAAGGSAAAS
jgi:SAM-dependent methyltransferase